MNDSPKDAGSPSAEDQDTGVSDESAQQQPDRDESSPDPQTRIAIDEEDLRDSLAALSKLAISQMGLAEALTQVAEFAVSAIPGADGAGLTLLEAGHPDTLVASAAFVGEVDAIQYGLEEGPCITAAAQGRTVRSGNLGGDQQWIRFGSRVERLGVNSVLSVPLITDTGVLGAMNIYAHARDAFDDRAALIGELFAVPAAIAVQSAQVLAQAKHLSVQLQAALTNRATIDHALGILMSRVGCGPDEAFDRLRQISQRENRKLSAIAQQMVDEAIRAARARHSQPD